MRVCVLCVGGALSDSCNHVPGYLLFPRRGETPEEVFFYQLFSTPLKKGVLNERISQTTSAVAIRSQPRKPASLRGAWFAICCPLLWWCWDMASPLPACGEWFCEDL